MMDWKTLLSPVRLGLEDRKPSLQAEIRSEFQRDYDRIIFSSPFRRLQNKTQVFPLPGSVFVHNRLTHSLEVASVGRSLANIVAMELQKRAKIDYFSELGPIVMAACLSHDMGNPPFGHSGEKAISRFFSEGAGKEIQSQVTAGEWLNFTHFEGNANAFRLLVHQFKGRRKGGFALTYATLGAMIKYPYGANMNQKKYGFFESERELFRSILNHMQVKITDLKNDVYARHPLVYLVEAADDISYQLMDLEDAHKLGILSTGETLDIMMRFFHRDIDKMFFESKESVFREVTDRNERIAFIRASLIGKLIREAAEVFLQHHEEILEGNFHKPLIKGMSRNTLGAMDHCSTLSLERIYRHKSVVDIEITGFNVIHTLLEEFTGAVLSPGSYYSRMLLSLLPEQFKPPEGAMVYQKIQSVLDFVSGMTDLYAADLYKKIKGTGL